MSNETTVRMVNAYFQMSQQPTRFLSGMFRTGPDNIFNSEEIEIDIEREDEDIAIVLPSQSTGPRMNTLDVYTNKRFKLPAFDEAFSIDSFELLKRQPGNNPFQDFSYRANLVDRVFKGMTVMEKKIRRSVELQAAQVMTTGKLDYKNAAGVTLFSIDYKPKATHFPTVTNSWSGASADPIGDLLSLSNVVRNDGLRKPEIVIMGEGSFENFVSNADIKSRLDTRRINLGSVERRPSVGEEGALRGSIDIGDYTLDIWTYSGRYKDPQTGNKVKYIADDKVIVKAMDARLDANWGGVPNIGRELGIMRPVLPEIPSKISDGNVSMWPHVYVTVDGRNLVASIAARPLLVPVAIDQYGCLDTEV